MFRSSATPIVFAGASLTGIGSDWRSRIECLPPIRDGDLIHLMQGSSPRPILILDGVFSEHRAVTPTECRELLRKGWPIFGASSMGALRAADLWPEGMIGIGDVFLAFRTGLLKSDGDVAVALDPFTYEEITLTTVFLRATAAALLVRGDVDTVGARKLLSVATKIHFLERTPEACRNAWQRAGLVEATWRAALIYLAIPTNNPKTRDARLALAHLVAPLWPGVSGCDRPGTLFGDEGDEAARLRLAARHGRTDRRPAKSMGGQLCPACAYEKPVGAIFCPECASTSHENQ